MWYVYLIIAVVFIYLIRLYLSLTYKVNKTENAKAELSLQLAKRFDIVPAIIETAKSLNDELKHTEFIEIAYARHKYMSSYTFKDIIEANTELTASLKKFFLIVRDSSAICADKSFLNLIKELSKIENKVSFTREIYNSVAEDMNKYKNKIIINSFAKIKKVESYYLISDEDYILQKSLINF